MNKTSKVIVTIVVIVVFIFLFGIIVGVRGDNGNKTPGIFGLIVFAGMTSSNIIDNAIIDITQTENPPDYKNNIEHV